MATAIAAFGGAGCAHTVVVATEPAGATVIIDGQDLGPAPVKLEKVVYVGDTLRVRAEREGYEPTAVAIPASELFIWPGLLAVVPLMGIPLSLPTLLIPVLGPFIAAAIAASWAIVTSPFLLSLALTRKYPDTVTIALPRKPKPATDTLVPGFPPGDDPNDLGANPLPDVGLPPPASDETAKPPSAKKPPEGANPPPR